VKPLPVRQLGTDESVQRHLGFGGLDGKSSMQMRRDAFRRRLSIITLSIALTLPSPTLK
jgi:hypothetical protein